MACCQASNRSNAHTKGFRLFLYFLFPRAEEPRNHRDYLQVFLKLYLTSGLELIKPYFDVQ
jgi:hypothetical protein